MRTIENEVQNDVINSGISDTDDFRGRPRQLHAAADGDCAGDEQSNQFVRVGRPLGGQPIRIPRPAEGPPTDGRDSVALAADPLPSRGKFDRLGDGFTRQLLASPFPIVCCATGFDVLSPVRRPSMSSSSSRMSSKNHSPFA